MGTGADGDDGRANGDATTLDGARVVVSDRRAGDLEVERPVFEGDGVDLRYRLCRDPSEVADLDGVDALLSDARTPVTAAALDALEDLSVVAQIGTGVDNVDVTAAHERGVVVTNVPDYSVEEVSTHALALLLAVARSTHTYDRAVRDGSWDYRDGRPIHRLSGQTLGIVGYGRIGRRTARKAAPLFDRVVASDPYLDAAEVRADGVDPVDLETLLGTADAVSLHVPLTDETRGMFDADAFAATSEGTLFVTTCRGPVVDPDALLAALADGTVRAAGLDVLPEEPPTDRRLVEHEATVVTPHAGWYSEEAAREVRRRAAEEARRVLLGEAPEHPFRPEWV